MSDILDKLRQKREIRNRIAELNQEKTFILRIKQAIEMIELWLNEAMEWWESEHAAYQAIDLEPDINVVDSFEGLAAERLAMDFPGIVEEIGGIKEEVSGVIGAIAGQYAIMDEYVEKLDAQIDELYAQLAAL